MNGQIYEFRLNQGERCGWHHRPAWDMTAWVLDIDPSEYIFPFVPRNYVEKWHHVANGLTLTHHSKRKKKQNFGCNWTLCRFSITRYFFPSDFNSFSNLIWSYLMDIFEMDLSQIRKTQPDSRFSIRLWKGNAYLGLKLKRQQPKFMFQIQRECLRMCDWRCENVVIFHHSIIRCFVWRLLPDT